MNGEGLIAGVILAGGRSSRMGGGDKGLRPLAGKPILAHVIDRIEPQTGTLALNANGDPSRFASFGLDIVPDPLPDMGPLGGVLAGLRWAAQWGPFARLVTVACDTPFFPRDLVQRLAEAADSPERIVMSRSTTTLHPTFTLWPALLANDLEALLRRDGPSSLRAFACERHRAAIVDFPIDGALDPFFNINTPEELARAERLMKEAGR